MIQYKPSYDQRQTVVFYDIQQPKIIWLGSIVTCFRNVFISTCVKRGIGRI